MRKMIMTKKLKAEHDRLLARLYEARDAVYPSFNSLYIPFNECYQQASMGTKAAFDGAQLELMRFESEMIAQGRGWRDQFGHFYGN